MARDQQWRDSLSSNTPRPKSDKFGILDSPSARERDVQRPLVKEDEH
jgi:hypothetical protein